MALTIKQPTDIEISALDQLESKLNQAAIDLIGQLPDHVGQLAESLAKQYQIPIWQFTCGILLAVHLEGRLSEFRLDPAWKQGLRTKELKCQHCGKMFKPRHINQPYCSNDCGLAAQGKLVSTKKGHPKDEPITLPTAKPKPNNPSSSTMGWSSTPAPA